MRWDALFADLESQAEGLLRAHRAAEVAERARIEVAKVGVFERLSPAVGCELTVVGAGGLCVRAVLQRLGPGWALLVGDDGRETLMNTAHLLSARGMGRRSATPGSEGIVSSRLHIDHALRAIAADRAICQLLLTDASSLTGTVERVGKDFVEVAVLGGQSRRPGDVRDVAVVVTAALVAVCRQSG